MPEILVGLAQNVALVSERGFTKRFIISGEQKEQTELGLCPDGMRSTRHEGNTLPRKKVDQEILGGNTSEIPSASFILGSNDTIQTLEFGEGGRVLLTQHVKQP